MKPLDDTVGSMKIVVENIDPFLRMVGSEDFRWFLQKVYANES